MAETVNVIVAIEDHERLLAIIGNRKCPLMHVQRAKKGSLLVKRLAVLEAARRASVSRPPSALETTAWRSWRGWRVSPFRPARLAPRR